MGWRRLDSAGARLHPTVATRTKAAAHNAPALDRRIPVTPTFPSNRPQRLTTWYFGTRHAAFASYWNREVVRSRTTEIRGGGELGTWYRHSPWIRPPDRPRGRPRDSGRWPSRAPIRVDPAPFTKRSKTWGRRAGIDAWTGVRDADHEAVARDLTADHDRAARRCVAHAVRHEIGEHLPDPDRVDVDDRQVGRDVGRDGHPGRASRARRTTARPRR